LSFFSALSLGWSAVKPPPEDKAGGAIGCLVVEWRVDLMIDADSCGEYNTAPPRTGWIRPATFPRRKIEYSPIGKFAVFEGDIILGTIDALEKGSQGTTPEGCALMDRRWPRGEIVYEIDPSLRDQERVDQAIRHWQERTNVSFRLRRSAPARALRTLNRVLPDFFRADQSTEDDNFVVFRRHVQLSASPVGMTGGMQVLLLSDGAHTGTVIHEIGHALGLWHEQSRWDRDDYVSVVEGNIQQSASHNFMYRKPGGMDLGRYDYSSIMHYHACAFAKSVGQPTLLCEHAIGQRDGLSPGDIFSVNFLYPRNVDLLDASDVGPALAVCGPRLMLGWTAKGTQQLHVRSSRDGITFGHATPIDGCTSDSPALCGLQCGVVGAWVDLASKRLHIARSDDGEVWGKSITTDFYSLSPPALARWNGGLVLAWRGQGDNCVHLAESRDANKWDNERVIAETTYSGPALSAAGVRLMFAWRSTSGALMAAQIAGATTLTDRVTLPASTAARPSLHTHENRLLLAWNEGPVTLLEEAGPGKWVGKAQLSGQCLDGPALATHAGRLVVASVIPEAGNRLRLTLI
jgi:hypothetical protein